MRRLLDPLQLEELVAPRKEPRCTPIERLVAVAKVLLTAFVVSTFSLLGIALALSGMPGVVP
ncbi:hypothetical protein J2W32_000352 [Variovorax boronicumulans]|uniref:Uncharacterized protein n=1 Tax=Variovorax boronicumulans TaxID=436515 RepID=A0AAW8CRX3_9BURK|nr:hypothetical protein [Variovorax boronicumulans]MDP9891255.1 hypothetical protein [Variovorax boronicumulans]MDQ0051323.1 hypothetical protein [Variovorax boronicumulans]